MVGIILLILERTLRRGEVDNLPKVMELTSENF